MSYNTSNSDTRWNNNTCKQLQISMQRETDKFVGKKELL